jgi:hypothetical protein
MVTSPHVSTPLSHTLSDDSAIEKTMDYIKRGGWICGAPTIPLAVGMISGCDGLSRWESEQKAPEQVDFSFVFGLDCH